MAERAAAAASLTASQRHVTLEAGTERAFSGQTANGYPHDCKSDGVYVCAVGDLPLFDSKTKFDSGTGWPSFWAPIDPQHVIELKDSSIPFMTRVEVLDARSGAHLGHVRRLLSPFCRSSVACDVFQSRRQSIFASHDRLVHAGVQRWCGNASSSCSSVLIWNIRGGGRYRTRDCSPSCAV
jgi:methionine-R-sulfoxide reductase